METECELGRGGGRGHTFQGLRSSLRKSRKHSANVSNLESGRIYILQGFIYKVVRIPFVDLSSVQLNYLSSYSYST